ncbi:MAG: hypothetical protein FWB76_07010 [Oscillospiraceae bacterium]|nr:hypothetical protein [Oscillospiraceae bacterium]
MQNIKDRLARNPRLWLAIAAGAGLAVALPVRIWQQLLLVEEYTGFWFDSSHPSVTVLYVFLALPLVLSLVIALLTRRDIEVDLTRRVRKAEGYVSLAAALFVLVSCVLAMLQAFATDVQGAALLAAVLEGIFGLGVVAFFANLGIVNLFPTSQLYLNRVLTLMPLLWAIARLLGHFSRTISYLRVSDLFLNIMSMVLLLLFFMAAAQVMSGVNAEKKMWRLAAVGLPAAVFLLLVFVPRMIAAPFNFSPAQDGVLNLADLGAAVFIAVFMLTRVQPKPEEEVEEEIAEEAATEEATEEITEAPAEEAPAEESPAEETPAEEAAPEEVTETPAESQDESPLTAFEELLKTEEV